MSKGIPVGFALAVGQESMTVEQAKTKGNRDAVAKRTADRHEISLRLAYEVADGKLRIQEALAQTTSSSPAVHAARAWSVYGWFIAAALVMLVGLLYYQAPEAELPIDPNPKDVAAAIAASRPKQVAKIERNEQNKITYIEGTTAQVILDLYAENTHSKALKLVKVNAQRVQALFEKGGQRFTFNVLFDARDKIWYAGGTGFPIPVKRTSAE